MTHLILPLLLSCSSGSRNEPPDILETDERPARARQHFLPTHLCVRIREDSPAFPQRLVFLYRYSDGGIDAQVELFARDETRERCGELRLRVREEQDTRLFLDFMPPVNTPTLEETIRLYAAPHETADRPMFEGRAPAGTDIYEVTIPSAP
jgi:hypothetical protein